MNRPALENPPAGPLRVDRRAHRRRRARGRDRPRQRRRPSPGRRDRGLAPIADGPRRTRGLGPAPCAGVEDYGRNIDGRFGRTGVGVGGGIAGSRACTVISHTKPQEARSSKHSYSRSSPRHPCSLPGPASPDRLSWVGITFVKDPWQPRLHVPTVFPERVPLLRGLRRGARAALQTEP